MGPKEVIKQNRKKLDRITRELVKIIAERSRLVKEIGEAKKELGTPVEDVKREEQVIGNAVKIGEECGVDGPLMEKIMKDLIAHAKKLEE